MITRCTLSHDVTSYGNCECNRWNTIHLHSDGGSQAYVSPCEEKTPDTVIHTHSFIPLVSVFWETKNLASNFTTQHAERDRLIPNPDNCTGCDPLVMVTEVIAILYINRSDAADNCPITCQAENSVGKDFDHVTLHVNCKNVSRMFAREPVAQSIPCSLSPII
jgi:hypothetical protein